MKSKIVMLSPTQYENTQTELASLRAQVDELRRFKRLAVKCFGYPRGAEMIGWSSEDSLWLAEQMALEEIAIREENK